MSGLDAWPGEREEQDDRLIETGAIPNYRGRLLGRMPVVMAPSERCVVCTRRIPVEGLCQRCIDDRDEEYARRRAWRWAEFVGVEKD